VKNKRQVEMKHETCLPLATVTAYFAPNPEQMCTKNEIWTLYLKFWGVVHLLSRLSGPKFLIKIVTLH
jgi:hypothetical protein